MLVIEMPNATNDFIQEMLMGNFNLKYGTKVQKLRAWDKVSIVTKVQSDDGEGCDESNPDSNGDRKEAANDPDIRVRQLSVAISRRPRRSHRVRRNQNSTIDGNDSNS